LDNTLGEQCIISFIWVRTSWQVWHWNDCWITWYA
jgi:hypothetical protein